MQMMLASLYSSGICRAEMRTSVSGRSEKRRAVCARRSGCRKEGSGAKVVGGNRWTEYLGCARIGVGPVPGW